MASERERYVSLVMVTPYLCVACIRLRYGFMFRRLPFALEIICRRGTFIWVTVDGASSEGYLEWLTGILNRRIKQRYATARKNLSNQYV